jgi:membrane-bound inhibitor of C-type lysozyme
MKETPNRGFGDESLCDSVAGIALGEGRLCDSRDGWVEMSAPALRRRTAFLTWLAMVSALNGCSRGILPAPQIGPPAVGVVRATFVCSADRRLNASFDNGPQPSVRLSLPDGGEMSLRQVVSGSGARYANSDESFVFWNKGNMAFIEEKGKRTYSDCKTPP